MKVRLSDIIDAIEFTDDETKYFLDMETGEIVIISEMVMSDEEKDAAYDKLDEHGFLRLPDRQELGDYDIMESFADSLSGTAQERLDGAISGRGAFRHFKDEIRRLGIENAWYTWHDDAYRRKAVEWCEENGIAYE